MCLGRIPALGSVRLVPERLTLCVDVGATSIKAVAVQGTGEALGARARRRTTYPVSPDALVATITELADRLEPTGRAAVGFPGMVRRGVVLSAANLARTSGTGSATDDQLVAAWTDFDLSGALAVSLGRQVKVANDADVAALGCSSGRGVELTVTLGTGVGTGLVVDGVLAPHLELSEISMLGASTLDDLLGERVRQTLSSAAWDDRVAAVLHQLDEIIHFDRCYLTGGNARRLRRDSLGPLLKRVTVVAEPVGLLGGIRLFD